MDKNVAKARSLARRQRRVRGKVSGTADRPRLRVTRSTANIYAQIIDDRAGVTLVSASSLEKDLREKLATGATVEAANAVGEAVAKKALDKGIKSVVFDRGGNLYHGRVKALADGARGAGLEF
jgi:large subunit ribosomal protein L18